ncbi:MAG TPA: T9SS type A sorting domain-containing protein, partial [Bacteroidia bacterium]|nr:T9SS type A sorting domain-containing protein [Bacteroidia bacterium]
GGRFGNDGICSMPNAGIDAQGNIFVSYCPLIEGTDSGNPSPLAFSYRNVYLQASSDGGATWGTPLNISDSQFDEAVFCSMAKNVDACVSLLWQQDGAPGYSVPPNGEHAIGNNDFVYSCVDKNLVISSVNEILNDNVSVSVFPNPASNNVMINYTVEKPVELIIEIRNIMGQVVANYTKNAESKGTHTLNVNVDKYSDGVYTVNTIIGDKVFSTKFVKN